MFIGIFCLVCVGLMVSTEYYWLAGLPIEPCLCSDECYMTFIRKPKQRITKELLKNVRKTYE